jgi:hypothetical protein
VLSLRYFASKAPSIEDAEPYGCERRIERMALIALFLQISPRHPDSEGSHPSESDRLLCKRYLCSERVSSLMYPPKREEEMTYIPAMSG